MNNEKMFTIGTMEIAEKLYELNCDMDYEDTKDETIKQLEEAIYEIKIIAKNEHNKDYWRVLYNALESIVY